MIEQQQGSRPISQSSAPKELVTRSGIKLGVRPASDEDQQSVLEFLRAVAPEDLRFRFLDAVRPSLALAHLLTRADDRAVENIIAFDSRDGSIAATATIAAQSSKTAEVAIVVRSDLKNKGIGWTLLSDVCGHAKNRGFTRVESIESSENRAALSLETELGFERQPCPGDATLTIVSKELC